MLRRILSISLVILFLFSVFSMVQPVSAKELPSTLDISIVGQEISKRLSMMKNKEFIDKSLALTTSPTRIVGLTNADVDTELLMRHFKTLHFSPKIGGVRYVVGVLKPGDHTELLDGKYFLALTRDYPVTLPPDVGRTLLDIIYNKDLSQLRRINEIRRLPLEPTLPELGGISNSRNYEPTMLWVNQILGAVDVWSSYGFNGSGITVAIVDTGVDYGSMGLGYDPTAVARDITGNVSAFDADAIGIAITNITVQAYASGGDVFINSSNTDPLIYIFGGLVPFSAINGTLWMADMNVTGILNPGDVAHFGLMFQWLFGLDIFPVLVVDSDANGFYDTVYVDMSFDWVWQGLNDTGYGPSTFDFSFADEPALTPGGWSVGGRDFNGDGLYDIDVSSLGYGLDIFGVVPNIYDQGSVLKPVDPYGNYTVFVYDWHGHGTSCANVVAGRPSPGLGGFSGVAPGASILGVPALFIGDIIEGWLWAAGFDLIPGTEGWGYVPTYGWVYGWWTYTGIHKADIISNSWGWSSWAYYFSYIGWFWYDALTVLEDALMVPGYLDPSYPGTLMVHAAGNGGPGYGTVTEPGYNTLALTVGASTSLNSLALLTQMYYGPDGYPAGADGDVISWSARGPNLWGNVKPEILGIGAYGWTAAPVWVGWGDGSATFTLFGGTSMATPTVAGVAALALEAAFANGYSYDPLLVKLLLKSTATDLGYDALTQGAGRVDALKVVEVLSSQPDVITASTGTYDNLYNKIVYPWLFAALLSSGVDIPFSPPSPPIYDYGWYAGELFPGESASTQLEFFNPNTTHINVSLTPVWYQEISSLRFDVNTYNYSWFGGIRPGALIPIDPALIPPDADLMVVTTNISYSDFDPEMDYYINNDIYTYVFDWNDTNGDMIPYSNESVLVNYAYPDGTTTEVKIGNPASKFGGTPLIRLYQYSDIYPMSSRPSIHVTVFVRFLKRVPWNWIKVNPPYLEVFNPMMPYSFTVDVNMNVPSNAAPGIYHGLILLNLTNLATNTWEIRAFPVTVKVMDYVMAYGQLSEPLNFTYNDPLYPANSVLGYFDWSWRAESGDWRIWPLYLEIMSPNLVGAYSVVNWSSFPTDIDLFSVDIWGFTVDGSEYTRIFGGAYLWYTRTGTTSEYVAHFPVTGPHMTILHNVLLDGSEYPEDVSGYMAFTYLYFLPPYTPLNLYGTLHGNYTVVGVNLQLATGLQLTNVTAIPYVLPSGWNMSSPPPFTVPGFSVKNFTVNIWVPTSESPGVYPVQFLLTYDQIPYYILVTVYVRVQKFPLPLSLTTQTSRGVARLNLPGEFGTLTVYTYIDLLNPSNSRKIVYPLHVENIIIGDRFTYIDLMVGIKINGRTWWVPSTLVIDRETRTVYLFGFIQFNGRY